MDIRCPSCSKLFRVADEKIAGKGIRFKCSKCAEVITITKDDFEMDLLARDADTAVPEAAPPAAAPKPVPPPPPVPPVPPAPQAEAREYVPPADQADDEQPADQQQMPSTALNDFDFSEPHEAAVSAAHPDAGFGGAGFSFDSGEEQDAAPEIEISPEAAAEAEAALQFPVDLISEPKRKPAFGSPPPAAQETASATGETDLGDALAIPKVLAVDAGMDDEDQGLDLGAALAMPKGTVSGGEPAPAAVHEPEPGSAPAAPKGPVITPELLAQMKRNASGKPSAPAAEASPAHEDMDLGAALAMPKTAVKETAEAEPREAASSRGAGSSLSGKGPLVIGLVALALVAVLGALYYLGFLWGMNDQEAQQKPQPKSPPTVRQMITAEGISIVDPSAFIDPERGDLVIAGLIKNMTDKPKQGWYLVTEVRDAKEAVLTTVKMVNGVQLYSAAERDLLEKRGAKTEDLRSALQKGAIPAQGSVNFELRVLNPPAGSAGFLPMLRAVDPATLGDGK